MSKTGFRICFCKYQGSYQELGAKHVYLGPVCQKMVKYNSAKFLARISHLRTCNSSVQNVAEPLLQGTVVITQNVTLSNAWEGKYTNGTKFNPGLALISLSRTGPWLSILLIEKQWVNNKTVNNKHRAITLKHLQKNFFAFEHTVLLVRAITA